MSLFSYLIKTITLITTSLFLISTAIATPLTDNPCDNFAGNWRGTAKYVNRPKNWSATAAAYAYPDQLYLRIDTQNDTRPPVKTNFNLYGKCENGTLTLHDKNVTFVGNIIGNSITLDNPLAKISLQKVGN